MAQFYMSVDNMNEKAYQCRAMSDRLESQMSELEEMMQFLSDNWTGETKLFTEIQGDINAVLELSYKLRLMSDKLQEVSAAYENAFAVNAVIKTNKDTE